MIRIPQVQLIDENGKSHGAVDTSKALQMAKDAGLDLVEVGPNVRPSVCKIMDWGKHQYQKAKAARKAAKGNQHAGEIKGVRISFRTSEHDMDVKAKRVDKFLGKGYKVRIEVFLRGRERAPFFREDVRKKLNGFMEMIETEHTIDQHMRQGPRGPNLIIKNQ